jgi:hypothetical protein
MKNLLIHLRKYDDKGQVSSNGGGTVYCVATDDGYICRTAFCNEKDVFCKKVGRAIVEGRHRIYGSLGGAKELSTLHEVKDYLFEAALIVGDIRPEEFFQKVVDKFGTDCSS